MRGEESATGQLNLGVVGISHTSAPVELLEQAALAEDALVALINETSQSDRFGAAYALSTCNRIELYVELATGTTETALRELLARHSALPESQLAPYLYQHSGMEAVRHLFSVASGLDSVVVGEDQILGQVKDALERSQRLRATSPMINQLVQDAIRVGKRTRSETDLNRAGRSLATVGLSELETIIGTLSGRSALVVGAGSMGGVVVAALRKLGLARIDVANRTPDKAARLAATAGGRGYALESMFDQVAQVDLVITCTSGTGVLIDAERATQVVRKRNGQPLFFLDLALPRNIDAAVADVTGVTLIDLSTLAKAESDDSATTSVKESQQIIETEIKAFIASRRAAAVGPALSAMRSVASTAVDSELDRLLRKFPALDQNAQLEIAHSVNRIVDKVMHGPTVRARELAALPEGDIYVEVMGKLFDHVSRRRDSEVPA
jgi:glutamyl-tRNA reductase